MAVQQNTDHIQTTHIGSFRGPTSCSMLKAKYSGQPYDERELNSVLAQAVTDCVRKQVECGIDIVTDGEYSKPGFFTVYPRAALMGSNPGPIRSSSSSSRRSPLSPNTMPSISRRR